MPEFDKSSPSTASAAPPAQIYVVHFNIVHTELMRLAYIPAIKRCADCFRINRYLCTVRDSRKITPSRIRLIIHRQNVEY